MALSTSCACPNHEEQLMSCRIALVLLMVLAAWPAAPAGAQGPFPFDQLGAASIPVEERIDGQPPELIAVLGSNRGRNWGGTTAVAYSSDGKYLAGAQFDAVYLWDAATLREAKVLRPPPGHSITATALAPDGQTVATATARFDAKKGRHLQV